MLTRLLWCNFRLLSSMRHWVSQHFTQAGRFTLSILFCAAILGIDTRQSLTFQIFTLLLALLLLAIINGLFFRIRFSVQRQLPRFATVGEPLIYRINIKNHSSHRHVRLSVQENCQDPRPTYATFCSEREPDSVSPHAFDRFFRYPRWQWLTQQQHKATFTLTALPPLLPLSTTTIKLSLKPLKRGVLRLTSTSFMCVDRLGLYQAIRHLPLPESLFILPKRYAMPSLPLPGSSRYHHGSRALKGAIGDTEAFVALREYRPSDSWRHIHWKSWAKTQRPMVKEYQAEYFTRHALLLDTFASAQYSEAFEEAISVAASFINTIELQSALLDLMFVGERAYRFTAGQGYRHEDSLLEILAAVTLCHNKSFSHLTDLITQHTSILSSCICVLLEWDEPRKTCIETLQSLNIPVWVFVIKQPQHICQIPPDAPYIHVLETGNIAAGLASL